MKNQVFATWFRVITVILILFGMVFIFFGLRMFSETIALVPRQVLLPWESALYGAIMVGWGVTLLFVGRYAFQRKDGGLKKALLGGLAVWLGLEALASAWFGVWFNVGVDVAVLALLAVPLSRTDST